MKKTLLSLLVILSASTLLFAGKKYNYDIEVKVEGLKDTEFYLAYYYARPKQQYIYDTFAIDSKGIGRIQSDSILEGLYIAVFPALGNQYFDIIIAEPSFKVSSDTVSLAMNVEFEGSLENQLFYEDRKFMMKKMNEANKVKAQREAALNSGDSATAKALLDTLTALNEDVMEYKREIQKNHPETFYSEFLYLTTDLKIPPQPADDDRDNDVYRYRYLKKHYWDGIDLTNEGILKTPVFRQKLDYYFEKMIPMVPDSMIAESDWILKQAQGCDEMFKYICVALLNEAAKSEVMCMDSWYVHMVLNYYDNGKAFWIKDEAELFRIVDRGKKLEPLQCGSVAPNVKMRDREFQYHELDDVESKYVLVYIWDPECGHCQKETPKLKRVYDSLRVEEVDFEVYAIANTVEYDKWHKFMDEKGLDWINVTAFSPEEQAFRAIYDVRSNPQFYLLNEEREIIAKRINSWQVFDYLMHLEDKKVKKGSGDTNGSEPEGKTKNKSKG